MYAIELMGQRVRECEMSAGPVLCCAKRFSAGWRTTVMSRGRSSFEPTTDNSLPFSRRRFSLRQHDVRIHHLPEEVPLGHCGKRG